MPFGIFTPMSTLREDIRKTLDVTGWPAAKLAKESGVPPACITRLLRGTRGGVHSTTLEKLWPFLYGPKRPDEATWESPTELLSDERAG